MYPEDSLSKYNHCIRARIAHVLCNYRKRCVPPVISAGGTNHQSYQQQALCTVLCV